MLAVGGGLLGAMSISILTEKVEIPDELLRMSLAMSRDDLGILTLVIIGPIAEEFVFREAIEGEMLRRGANPWAAIIVSAVAFGAVHLNLAQGLYALPLGLIFGIIYYKTGNIILTSLLHILNNGFVVLMLRAEGEGIADVSCAEWFGSSLRAYIFMAFSAVFCFVLMRQFWNIYQPRDETMKSGLY